MHAFDGFEKLWVCMLLNKQWAYLTKKKRKTVGIYINNKFFFEGICNFLDPFHLSENLRVYVTVDPLYFSKNYV